jgi:hypothetical protein
VGITGRERLASSYAAIVSLLERNERIVLHGMTIRARHQLSALGSTSEALLFHVQAI